MISIQNRPITANELKEFFQMQKIGKLLIGWQTATKFIAMNP